MNKKKIYVSLISFFLMTFMIADHGSAHRSVKGVTINALLENHPTVRVIAKLLPEFEHETGILVNIEVIPFESMTKKARASLNRKSDRYDVYMDGWTNAIEWASHGHLECLESYIEKKTINRYLDLNDFIAPYLADAVYNGKLYGLPVYGESTFFYYRKDLFSLYGIKIPRTMEDVRDAAGQIKSKCKDIYGITLRGRSGIHSIYIWASFLWAFGGRWMDENGRSDLDTPEAVKATAFYTDMLHRYAPPAYNEFGWNENRDLFLSGKAAMSIDTTVNGAFNEDPEKSLVAGKVGYLPTPKSFQATLKGGPSSLVTHQMYLNAYANKKDAAFLFVSWATSKKIQIKGMGVEPNCGVTSKKAMESKIFNEKFGAFKKSMLGALKIGNPEYLPRLSRGPEIFEKVGNALSRVVAGMESPDKAMKRVNYEINSEIIGE